jgi:UDP-glucose 4-epimerase
VTGGAGFIGSRLGDSLLGEGYDVVVADNLSTGKRENVPAEALFVDLDLTREEELAKLPERPYAGVLHLAGQSSAKRSFDDPVLDFDANARSTLFLARWSAEHDVPVLVHASSMGVYGNGRPEPVSEDGPTVPISYYGVSKLAAERLLVVAASSSLRTCSLRMFNVYGTGQNLDDLDQGMVSIYLAYVVRGQPVLVKGPLDRVRDLVHVDDVVEAWKLALTTPVTGPFNIGTGIGTRVDDLLQRLFRACGTADDYPIVEGPRTPGDPYRSVADVSRARRELGWEPRVTLDVGLEEFAAGATARSTT